MVTESLECLTTDNKDQSEQRNGSLVRLYLFIGLRQMQNF